MNREQALYYIDRWELVKAVERRELQHMSMKRRFEQTATMFASGLSFPKDDVFARQRAEEVERVRRTWEELKRGKT
jgi:hypothetical protein